MGLLAIRMIVFIFFVPKGTKIDLDWHTWWEVLLSPSGEEEAIDEKGDDEAADEWEKGRHYNVRQDRSNRVGPYSDISEGPSTHICIQTTKRSAHNCPRFSNRDGPRTPDLLSNDNW